MLYILMFVLGAIAGILACEYLVPVFTKASSEVKAEVAKVSAVAATVKSDVSKL